MTFVSSSPKPTSLDRVVDMKPDPYTVSVPPVVDDSTAGSTFSICTGVGLAVAIVTTSNTAPRDSIVVRTMRAKSLLCIAPPT